MYQKACWSTCNGSTIKIHIGCAGLGHDPDPVLPRREWLPGLMWWLGRGRIGRGSRGLAGSGRGIVLGTPRHAPPTQTGAPAHINASAQPAQEPHPIRSGHKPPGLLNQ
jgi:hypothetical protein